MSVSVAAVDLGASSGRVMVGDVGPGRLALRAVARFANEPVALADGLHWDPLDLYRHALDGLWTAANSSPDGLASVAVDSWAVDYALMRSGHMLGVPFHYRDGRTARGVARVHATVPAAELYARNGLQFLPFNTLYQLAADDLVGFADQLLLVPDLIGYWLTGRFVAERTNASTTGLLDATTRQWDTRLAASFDVQASMLPELIDPGVRIGKVTSSVGKRIGAPGLAVTAVGSHDTASAVVGVPMLTDDAAYISCGTWGLVGVELDAPVLTDEARAANFTNEGGVDGTTRFLTNVMGTWLISETLRTWERDGAGVELTKLLPAAAEVTDEVTVFDVQDPRFMAPGDMPKRILDWCREHGKPMPVGKPEILRSIIESLASAFAQALDTAQTLARRPIRRVHIVGGGSLNRVLCQAVADRSGRPVVAGPVEATALGNVLVQARALGAVDGDLADLRELIAATHSLEVFTPRR
ncbi:rhamnulokinase [Aeromicrobium fastidiosum]|uniref:Rhamnulokinase n=1 Tax=Aeromicrobium fastidiosum TaxID=52699 RepID=A0A641ASG6_9ACTN|nr:rhamnulokinase family protein [Aeromicrobium fastidiosum]KAA1380612.1 rhamnulokinase [Aeromicrobium fastidiosum]MBP2390214.1 rhamnulokinase [Aeromicrobium fastidiosum]